MFRGGDLRGSTFGKGGTSRRAVVLAILLLVVATGQALAQTVRYVEENGLDSDDCTVACATLGYAVEQAEAGDVVVVIGRITETVTLTKDITLSGGTLNGHLHIISSTVTLSDMTIENGRALNGGGLAIEASEVTLNRLTIRNNGTHDGSGLQSNGGDGGGIFVTDSTLHISDSSITHNHTGDGVTVTHTVGAFAGYGGYAGDGGGIYAVRSTLLLTNTTISGNQTGDASRTGGDGGGLYLGDNSTATLRNVTLANNTVGGAGLLCGNGDDLYVDATVTLINALTFNCHFALTHPLMQSRSLGCDGTPFGAVVQPLDEGVHLLRPDHDAIDEAADCPPTDQRGEARDDLGCDIGATELQLADSRIVTQTVGDGLTTFGGTLVGVVTDRVGRIGVEKVAGAHPVGSVSADSHYILTATHPLTIDLSLPLPPNANPRICQLENNDWECGGVQVSDGQRVTRTAVSGSGVYALADGVPLSITQQQVGTKAHEMLAFFLLFSIALSCAVVVWRRVRMREDI